MASKCAILIESLSGTQFLSYCGLLISGAQFEGDWGKILALGAEISPYIGVREKWESP